MTLEYNTQKPPQRPAIRSKFGYYYLQHPMD
jgi:hypothetical protein